MERPLRFGIFMAPFHPVGQNPTLALERDLELPPDFPRPLISVFLHGMFPYLNLCDGNITF